MYVFVGTKKKKKMISSGAMALGYVGIQCQNDNATPSRRIDVDTMLFRVICLLGSKVM